MTVLAVLAVLAAAPACGAPAPAPAAKAQDVNDGGMSSFEAEMEAEEARLWAEAMKAYYLPDGGRVMKPPFRWEMRNVIDEVAMPGVQESMGVPVKLHSVRVKNNLRGVLEEIVGSFERQGLYIQPVDTQPQFTAETAVTGLDMDRFISYTALIRCEKSGICTVVLGEANIGLAAAMKQANKSRSMWAPLPPSAKSVMQSSTEGLQSISFAVAVGEKELKQWYAVELPKLGYKARSDGLYKKGDEVIQLTTRRQDGELFGMLVKRAALPNEQ
jgi:hypothetical protein